MTHITHNTHNNDVADAKDWRWGKGERAASHNGPPSLCTGFHNMFALWEINSKKSIPKGSCKWCQGVYVVLFTTDYNHHQVEAFLMHPSFTSKGGFRISINGVRIYQVWNYMTHNFVAHTDIVKSSEKCGTGQFQRIQKYRALAEIRHQNPNSLLIYRA